MFYIINDSQIIFCWLNSLKVLIFNFMNKYEVRADFTLNNSATEVWPKLCHVEVFFHMSQNLLCTNIDSTILQIMSQLNFWEFIEWYCWNFEFSFFSFYFMEFKYLFCVFLYYHNALVNILLLQIYLCKNLRTHFILLSLEMLCQGLFEIKVRNYISIHQDKVIFEDFQLLKLY